MHSNHFKNAAMYKTHNGLAQVQKFLPILLKLAATICIVLARIGYLCVCVYICVANCSRSHEHHFSDACPALLIHTSEKYILV